MACYLLISAASLLGMIYIIQSWVLLLTIKFLSKSNRITQTKKKSINLVCIIVFVCLYVRLCISNTLNVCGKATKDLRTTSSLFVCLLDDPLQQTGNIFT